MAQRSVPFPAIELGPSAKNGNRYGPLNLARSRIALFLASTALVALSSGCSHRPEAGPEGGEGGEAAQPGLKTPPAAEQPAPAKPKPGDQPANKAGEGGEGGEG